MIGEPVKLVPSTLSMLEQQHKRGTARSRVYRDTANRYRLEVTEVQAGRQYAVRDKQGTTTVWATSCDSAATQYLKEHPVAPD